jgi:hypothetical protein
LFVNLQYFQIMKIGRKMLILLVNLKLNID